MIQSSERPARSLRPRLRRRRGRAEVIGRLVLATLPGLLALTAPQPAHAQSDRSCPGGDLVVSVSADAIEHWCKKKHHDGTYFEHGRYVAWYPNGQLKIW
jgi:hypothetical protein